LKRAGAAGVEDAAGDVDVAFGVAVEENLVAVKIIEECDE